MNLDIQEIGKKILKSENYNGSIFFNEDMTKHTTMKVGGKADLFVCPKNEISCIYALYELSLAKIKTYVLGAGSNVVVDDKGFRGAIISTENFNEISIDDFEFADKFATKDEKFELKSENSAGKTANFCGESVAELKNLVADFTESEKSVGKTAKSRKTQILCGSGALVNEVLEFCEKKGLKTLDKFAGLPASLGGATYMNARCYSVEIREFINKVEYLDLCELEELLKNPLKNENAEKNFFKNKQNLESVIKIYQNNKEDSSWAYKISPFTQKNYLITKVWLNADVLSPESFEKQEDAPFEIQNFLHQENQKYVQDRILKGHFNKPSSGSVFKNNRNFNAPSGKLIDECGLKGTVIGGAEISSWHGNFIVNNGNACAQDIKTLVKLAQTKVKQKFGFDLECEIIFI